MTIIASTASLFCFYLENFPPISSSKVKSKEKTLSIELTGSRRGILRGKSSMPLIQHLPLS